MPKWQLKFTSTVQQCVLTTTQKTTIRILMDVLLWSTDQHLCPLAGHVHKNVSVSTSYIITLHLSVAIRHLSSSWKRLSHLAAMPCFYLKQQEEVNYIKSLCVLCGSWESAHVIMWNCSLRESKDAQPSVWNQTRPLAYWCVENISLANS